ncbi:MAG: ComF family protein [Campylobacterota bacterium]|nr:ComF family protein [Campylobacterota bacterium]
MRCISCENLSINIICKTCQNNFLLPIFHTRELKKDFFVYSFYNYEEIQNFLNTKYQFYGDRVFNILAKLSFNKFAQNFLFDQKIYAIPIDDHTRHEFSQTAILAKHLKSHNITPIYNTLKATNIIKYAGKDLEFRKKNRRDFIYTGEKNLQVILVDDLVTTGLTILEAKDILEKNGCTVLFALTLSDAKV